LDRLSRNEAMKAINLIQQIVEVGVKNRHPHSRAGHQCGNRQ
jgi:hypothetical protein